MLGSTHMETTLNNRGGKGGRNHDVVFIGVNKMSQLYKLDEKQPFANHLFCWLHL